MVYIAQLGNTLFVKWTCTVVTERCAEKGEVTLQLNYFFQVQKFFTPNFGKISAQPHTSLFIQFLDKENNGDNSRWPLGYGFVLE